MATEPSESGFSPKLFFTAAGVLAVLAAGAIGYVLLSSAKPDAMEPGGGVAAVEVPAAQTEAPAEPVALTGENAAPADPPAAEPLEQAVERSVASPVAPPAAAPAPPVEAAAVPGEGSGATSVGAWRIGPVTVGTSAFGFVEGGVEGAARLALPAPPGARYVTVRARIEWAGVDSRRFQFASEDATSVRAAVADGRVNSLGRREEDATPTRPWSTEPLVMEPGEAGDFALVFLLSEEATSVTLEFEGAPGPVVELAATGLPRVEQVVGLWRRSDRLLGRVRWDDPVIDAMIVEESRLLSIAKAPGGALSLQMPGAGITGTGRIVDAGKSGGLVLKRGTATSAARLRLVEEDGWMLVYLGAEAGAAVLYERIPQGAASGSEAGDLAEP